LADGQKQKPGLPTLTKEPGSVAIDTVSPVRIVPHW
jgi:hypothetical protein